MSVFPGAGTENKRIVHRGSKKRLVAYAKERGWIIAGLFVDAERAPKNMHKRSEFQKMLDLVRADGVDNFRSAVLHCLRSLQSHGGSGNS